MEPLQEHSDMNSVRKSSMPHTDGIKSTDVKAHKIKEAHNNNTEVQNLLIRLRLAAYIRGAMTMAALSL